MILVRLGIAFLFFTVCRVIFYLLNSKFFHDVGIGHFFSGAVFDISAISMYFAPFVVFSLLAFVMLPLGKWYHRLVNGSFHVANVLCIAMNALDFEFFKFTAKRTTCDFFSMMSYGDDAKNLIPSMLKKYWFIALCGVALIVLSFWVYRKTRSMWHKSLEQLPNWKGGVALFILGGGLLFMGARMSFAMRPLNLINAADYSEPENIPLVLNTPFSMIKTINEPALPYQEYFHDALVLRKYYDPVVSIQPYDTTDTHPNVIVFIMESFSHEFFGSLTGKKTYTPFLDSLMQHSLVFTNAFANGKRSIEATPTVVSSLPTLMDNPFISSSYGNNKVESMASVLKRYGYHTSFFHGATNGSMAFDKFTAHVGFEKYFGRKEFGNDEHHDGTWGIFDEEFFQFMADYLDQERQPFLSVHFTLTSHSPYPLPERYKSRFKGGPTPMHNCIRYTDFSFQKYFDRVRNASWFKNTIFLFTADHTSDSDVPFYAGSFGRYRVPMFIYSADGRFTGSDDRIVQQLDMFPTAMSIAGVKEELKCFGKPFFKDGYRFSVQYVNGVYQMIDSTHVLQYNGQEIKGYFKWQEDPLLENDLQHEEQEGLKERLKYLQAYLQQYFHALQYNQLSVK